jgi:3-deoxy-manno-octulosonate cytidylyltransferase (CMP-KDO synthetase)
MKTMIVIPARLGSTRLPRKPLLRETGKYLIQHVVEQARQARAGSNVVVATDAEDVAAAVRSFGGQVVLTSPDHPSGTDRIAEVAQKFPDIECFLNVQGDEPRIEPDAIDQLQMLMLNHPAAKMATLAVPIRRKEDWLNPNVVKVIHDDAWRAVVFSRSPIPYCRDGEPDFHGLSYLQHLGVYAYRRDALLQLAKMPPHPWEMLEKLEQLRALAAGWPIMLGIVPHAFKGVDTPEDYADFLMSLGGRTFR